MGQHVKVGPVQGDKIMRMESSWMEWVPLQKRPQGAPLVFHHMTPQQEEAMYEPGGKLSSDTTATSASTLAFLTSRTLRIKFLSLQAALSMVFCFSSLNTLRQWGRVPSNLGTGNGEERASQRDNTFYLFSSHKKSSHTWSGQNRYFVFYQKMELKTQWGEYLPQVTQWKHGTAGLEVRYQFASQGSGLTLCYLRGSGYWCDFKQVC